MDQKEKAPGSQTTGQSHPAINLQCKMYPRKLTSGCWGGFPLWGIFEVIASSAVMLWVPLEIARRQDTGPLFHGLLGSDEALFPNPQGDDCRWQAKMFWSLRLSWKDRAGVLDAAIMKLWLNVVSFKFLIPYSGGS